MILERHKYHYFELLAKLSQLKAAPSNISLLSEIQFDLIDSIQTIERKIRASRLDVQQIKAFLGNPIQHPSKLAAIQAKERIQSTLQSIRVSKYLIYLLRCIADSIAFLVFPKWDIKPFAVKEHPGFLSRKLGLRRELKILHTILDHGEFALLCDITNCLRYGDIAVWRDGRLNLVEVKSTKNTAPRTERQLAKAQSVLDYIHKDFSTDPDIPQAGLRRVSLSSSEVSHASVASTVIANAARSSSEYISPENGLHYFAVTQADDLKQIIPKLTLNSSAIHVLPLYPSVESTAYYYPLPLSLEDPNALWSLYMHDVSFFVAFEHNFVRSFFDDHGFEVAFHEEDEWALAVKPKGSTNGISDIRVSQQLLARLATEFLGLKWFLGEICAMFEITPMNLQTAS